MKKLSINEKITVLFPNDLVPQKFYGTLKGYYFSSYAQYETALYLFIQRPRAKKLDRVVITEGDTAYILKGKLEETWRRETIEKNNILEVKRLHRLTEKDFNEDQIIFKHDLYEIKYYKLNEDYEKFADLTADFIAWNNINVREAADNEGYLNYIKDLIQEYNVKKLKTYFNNLGYSILVNCIDKAVNYNW